MGILVRKFLLKSNRPLAYSAIVCKAFEIDLEGLTNYWCMDVVLEDEEGAKVLQLEYHSATEVSCIPLFPPVDDVDAAHGQ